MLTLITLMPMGGATSMLRHAVITTAAGFSASMAMAAVDVSPVREDQRGPLRFAAGLAAGLAGGVSGNVAATVARNRLPSIVVNTLDLARAASRVGQQVAYIRAFGHTAADLRQLAYTIREMRSIQTRIQQLSELAATRGVPALEEAPRSNCNFKSVQG